MGLCISNIYNKQKTYKTSQNNIQITKQSSFRDDIKDNKENNMIINIKSLSEINKIENDINQSIDKWKNIVTSSYNKRDNNPKEIKEKEVENKINITDYSYKEYVNSFILDIEKDFCLNFNDIINTKKININSNNKNNSQLNFKAHSKKIINSNEKIDISFKTDINNINPLTKTDIKLFPFNKNSISHSIQLNKSVNLKLNFNENINRIKFNQNINNNDNDIDNEYANIYGYQYNNSNGIINRTFTELNSSICYIKSNLKSTSNYSLEKGFLNQKDSKDKVNSSLKMNFNNKYNYYDIKENLYDINNEKYNPIIYINNYKLYNDKYIENDDFLILNLNKKKEKLKDYFSNNFVEDNKLYISHNKNFKILNIEYILLQKKEVLNSLSQGNMNNCSLICSLMNIFYYYCNHKKIIFNNNLILKSTTNENEFYLKLNINQRKYYVEINDYFDNKFTKYYSSFKAITKFSDLNLLLYIIEKAMTSLYISNISNINDIDKDNFFELNEYESNPSLEVFYLTGWIPEVIEISGLICVFELSWKKLKYNFEIGNILISLGTNDNIKTKSIFKSKHCYLLIEIYDYNEDNSILKLRDTNGIDEVQISYKDLIDNFSNLFISWNPDIYPYKYCISDKFSSFLTNEMNFKSQNEDFSLEYNPQYLIKIPKHEKDFEIRIILSKDFDNLSSLNSYHRPKITFKIFNYEGRRVIIPVDSLKNGSLQREICSEIIIFENSDSEDEFVIVILKTNLDGVISNEEQNRDKSNKKNKFTLSIYSFMDIKIYKLNRIEYKTKYKINDFWGNKLFPACSFDNEKFLYSPCYSFSLKHKLQVLIKLETLSLANIMIIVYNRKINIGQLNNEIISDLLSKNNYYFFNCFSIFEGILDKGEYSIFFICEEINQSLNYNLTINYFDEYEKNKDETLKIDNFSYFINNRILDFKHKKILNNEWNKKNWFYDDNQIINKIIKYSVIVKNPGYYIKFTEKTKLRLILKVNNVHIKYCVIIFKVFNYNNSEEDIFNKRYEIEYYFLKTKSDKKEIYFNSLLFVDTIWGYSSK